METQYWRKIGDQWVNFFNCNEKEEPRIGEKVKVMRSNEKAEVIRDNAGTWKIIDVIWNFKPENIFSCFDVYVE